MFAQKLAVQSGGR